LSRHKSKYDPASLFSVSGLVLEPENTRSERSELAERRRRPAWA
jgi:hypothetical protein